MTANPFADADIAPGEGEQNAPREGIGAAGHEASAEVCTRCPKAIKEKTKHRGQYDGSDKHADEAATGKKADKGRRDKIKLFFDGEGPRHDKPNPRKTGHADENVLQEEKLNWNAKEIAGGKREAAWEQSQREKDCSGEKKDPEVVDGQNAKHAAHVKGAEIVR